MLFQLIIAFLILFQAQYVSLAKHTEGVDYSLKKSTNPSDTTIYNFNIIDDDDDDDGFENKVADFNEYMPGFSLSYDTNSSTNTYFFWLDKVKLEPHFFIANTTQKRLFLLYHQLKIDC